MLTGMFGKNAEVRIQANCHVYAAFLDFCLVWMAKIISTVSKIQKNVLNSSVGQIRAKIQHSVQTLKLEDHLTNQTYVQAKSGHNNH